MIAITTLLGSTDIPLSAAAGGGELRAQSRARVAELQLAALHPCARAAWQGDLW